MKTIQEKFEEQFAGRSGYVNPYWSEKIKSFIQSEVEEILEEIEEACIYGGVAYSYVDIETITEIFKEHGFDLTKKWL